MTKNPADYIESDLKNVWHHMTLHQGKAPMIMVEGKGCVLKDINGKEYIDGTSGGVLCVNVGFGRDRIADAAAAQMKKLAFYPAVGGTIPAIEFSEKLLSYMPGFSRVYISSSGSEANEKAFKMIRLAAYNSKDKKDKIKILYRHREYHGTTYATMSCAGQAERKEGFGPMLPGFVEFTHASCYRCAFNKTYPGCNIECARSIEDTILKEGPDTVGGIILEPVTAGGGAIPPVKEYYKIVREICDKYDVKMIMDEVVCGLGRTGDMFGYQHYGVMPDIVTMAKGVASAYMPISCTVTTEEIFKSLQKDDEILSHFRDISTFAGCAAGPVAAMENLKIIEEEKLLDNVKNMGNYLLEGLQSLLSHPNVGEVRGLGLLCGVELVVDKATKEPMPEATVAAITGDMAANGVLVNRTMRGMPGQNNVINIAPAYVITKEQIDTILEQLTKSIKKVLG